MLCLYICTTLQDFEPPSGDIKSAIEKDFGSVEDLSKKFNAKAATVQVQLLTIHWQLFLSDD